MAQPQWISTLKALSSRRIRSEYLDIMPQGYHNSGLWHSTDLIARWGA